MTLQNRRVRRWNQIGSHKLIQPWTIMCAVLIWLPFTERWISMSGRFSFECNQMTLNGRFCPDYQHTSTCNAFQKQEIHAHLHTNPAQYSPTSTYHMDIIKEQEKKTTTWIYLCYVGTPVPRIRWYFVLEHRFQISYPCSGCSGKQSQR